MLKRLNWQAVAAFGIFVAGFVGTLHALPPEFWSKLPPEFYAALGVSLAGALTALVTGKLFHPTPEAVREEAAKVLSKPPAPPEGSP